MRFENISSGGCTVQIYDTNGSVGIGMKLSDEDMPSANGDVFWTMSPVAARYWAEALQEAAREAERFSETT